MNRWSVLHQSLVTDHQSPAEEKAPGSSGGCKPGAGGLRQRQGRSKLVVSLRYAADCAVMMLAQLSCSTARIIGL